MLNVSIDRKDCVYIVDTVNVQFCSKLIPNHDLLKSVDECARRSHTLISDIIN